MVRKENDKIDYYAGVKVVEELRAKKIDAPVLIFCGDEKRAKQNAIEKNLSMDNVIITNSSQILRNFCTFKDLCDK